MTPSLTALRPLHDGAACRPFLRSVHSNNRSDRNDGYHFLKKNASVKSAFLTAQKTRGGTQPVTGSPSSSHWHKRFHLLTVTIPSVCLDLLWFTGLVVVLLPAWMRFAYYYVFCSNRRSVRYGVQSCRQTLDVYPAHPTNTTSSTQRLRPVVVFVPGGAWMIAYKMWGALLARSLTAAGVVVVSADTRQYPTGTVPDQVDDVSAVLEWTVDNVRHYGGDPSQVVVVGDSAGGHVLFMALVQAAIAQDDADQDSSAPSSWTPSDFKGFFSSAAPYNLDDMKESMQKHGMSVDTMQALFGGKMSEYNPLAVVQSTPKQILQRLPPIRLHHGTADATVPYRNSVEMHDALVQAGVLDAEVQLYSGWCHTHGHLKGPMQGNLTLHEDLLQALTVWTGVDCSLPMDSPLREPWLPLWWLEAGYSFMPF